MKGKKTVGEKFYLAPSSNINMPYYTQWLQDPLVLRGLGLETAPNEVEQKKWFKKGISSPACVRFEIVEKATKKPIGFCMLHELDDKCRSAKVAVFIGDSVYRYRGFGCEALHLLCRYALFELKLHTLWCEVPSYNSAAFSIFNKQGFSNCGLRHHAGMVGDKYYNLATFELVNQRY